MRMMFIYMGTDRAIVVPHNYTLAEILREGMQGVVGSQKVVTIAVEGCDRYIRTDKITDILIGSDREND